MNAFAAVTIVGGLGLFLLGIHHLTEGLKGLAGWQPPAGFKAGSHALAAWLKNPEATADPAIFKALGAASKQLTADRKTGRDQMLEGVALQRTPTATARTVLDALTWADSTLYHAWRLAESVRIAAGNRSAAAF